MTDVEVVRDLRTFDRVPARYAASTPDAVAIRCPNRLLTWREFEDTTNQLANQLVASGITDGARFAYLGKNSPAWIQLLFAAAKARAIMVSVNWRLAPGEIAFVLQDSGARLFVVADGFFDQAQGALEHETSVEVVKAIGAGHGWDDFEAWLEAGDIAPPGLPADENDTLCLCYTSGTTGNPKGAEETHRTFVETSLLLADVIDANIPVGDECGLNYMPPFHSNGPNLCYSTLSQGSELILMDEWDTEGVLSMIDQYPVKTLAAVPTMLQLLLDHPKAATTNFARLRYVVYGAAPIPLALLRRAIARIGCDFVQAYGLTENPIAVALLPEDHSETGTPQMASVGRALPRVEMRIVGDDGCDVPTGDTGEIWIRSVGRMKRYWNNPSATAKAITDEGWLRTGDAASQDENGYVYLKDRINDMIISGGENVYPAEVESVLYEHDKVHEVAVVGVPDDKWGEVPLAVVVATDAGAPTLDELLEFAGPRLARYKLPKRLRIVDALPRNASQKVLRRVLRQQFSDATDTVSPTPGPL